MKKAYTLADVLITLMIIFIVALLTVPALLESNNKTKKNIQEPKIEKTTNYDYVFNE